MTKKIYQQRTKPLHSALSTMDASTPQSQYAAVNTKEASGQHSTQSVAAVSLPSSTTSSGGITSNPTNSVKKPVNSEIAASLFRSTLLALLTLGLVKRGHDKNGNTVIVLPADLWNDLRLKSASTVGTK